MNSRHLLGAATFVAGLAISLALASQYLGGLQPCELCLEQRVPYYIGVPFMLLGLLAWPRLPRSWRLVLLGAMGAIFLWGLQLAIYHAGVEWGFWPGPTACSGLGGEIDFDAIMDMTPVVRCDVVQFRLLGISLAGYNALATMLIVGLIGLAASSMIRKPLSHA